MPGRTVYNGAQPNYAYEFEVGPSGADVQIIAERGLVPIESLADSTVRFAIDATAGGKALPGLPANATRVLLAIETASIRFWTNGKAPDAAGTPGILLIPPAGDAAWLMINGRRRLELFKAVRIGGVSANVSAEYYL